MKTKKNEMELIGDLIWAAQVAQMHAVNINAREGAAYNEWLELRKKYNADVTKRTTALKEYVEALEQAFFEMMVREQQCSDYYGAKEAFRKIDAPFFPSTEKALDLIEKYKRDENIYNTSDVDIQDKPRKEKENGS